VLQSIQSDENLVERASGGDERALAAIFRRYHQELFRYCAALLGNSEDAADALQNTMVKVLGALPGERRHLHLKAWLYRIAHNESVELLRKRRDLDEIDPEVLVGTEGPEVTAETRERLRQLILDLRELPERQRGALVMRELGGLSFEQIGSAFETSPAVARQTVYEARLGLTEMEKGRAMECDEVRRRLSDGDRRTFRRRDVRAHLRRCEECREFEAEISSRRADLAAISPLPALAAAGVLKGTLGGAAGSAGGAAVGAGAAGTISSSVAVKVVATVAVASAIGAGAADRAGVVHIFDRGRDAEAPAAAGGAHHGSTPAAAAELQSANRVRGDGKPGAIGERAATQRTVAPGARKGRADGIPSSQSSGSAPLEAEAPPTVTQVGRGRGHAKAAGNGAGAANAHGANPNAKGGNPNAKGGNPKANGGNHSAASEGKAPPGKGKQEGQAKPPKTSSKEETKAIEAAPPGQPAQAHGVTGQATANGKPDG
jgi:RNA polymerase sigma factor (sigma-70 family)